MNGKIAIAINPAPAGWLSLSQTVVPSDVVVSLPFPKPTARVLRFVLSLTLFSFGSMVEAKRVVILGIDGMDPVLLERYVAEGRMPNFAQLINSGDYRRLGTTMPAQSPVAWSTFITGTDPAGHGIYDFVHRNPKTMFPFLSISEAVSEDRAINLGTWVLPLSSGKVNLLRKGQAFWEILGNNGIASTIYRMPVNFPPIESPGRSLSGMGTPDILGSPGTFSFYSDRSPAASGDITGGKVFPVVAVDDRIDATLYGPQNPFRRVPTERSLHLKQLGHKTRIEYEHPTCEVNFQVFTDPAVDAAKFVVGEHEFILKVGEWSDWIPLRFEAIPWLINFNSIARFYLQELRPHFKLYVSPMQIDPADPVMPISYPSDWSRHLCSQLGYFYTQNLPEDTKAFSHGIFSGREFLEQAMLVFKERIKALDFLVENQRDDLLFVYFGTIDQVSHMLWRYMDEKHPAYIEDDVLRNGIRFVYEEMDKLLGRVERSIDPDTTLIVMSDHGFAPFYWGVNLNTWLLEKGYIVLLDPATQGEHEYFQNVDWRRTRAYAFGLNGIYVNLSGREKNGIVKPGIENEELLRRLEADLSNMRDSRNGNRAISLVVRPQRDFRGAYKHTGPDLIVGYTRGYRSSWESPLGEFPMDIFVDNEDAWSGDHCIDPRLVPGILITNQRISLDAPGLHDLTVAVLDEFGLSPLPDMIGKDCLVPLTQN